MSHNDSLWSLFAKEQERFNTDKGTTVSGRLYSTPQSKMSKIAADNINKSVRENLSDFTSLKSEKEIEDYKEQMSMRTRIRTDLENTSLQDLTQSDNHSLLSDQYKNRLQKTTRVYRNRKDNAWEEYLTSVSGILKVVPADEIDLVSRCVSDFGNNIANSIIDKVDSALKKISSKDTQKSFDIEREHLKDSMMQMFMRALKSTIAFGRIESQVSSTTTPDENLLLKNIKIWIKTLIEDVYLRTTVSPIRLPRTQVKTIPDSLSIQDEQALDQIFDIALSQITEFINAEELKKGDERTISDNRLNAIRNLIMTGNVNAENNKIVETVVQKEIVPKILKNITAYLSQISEEGENSISKGEQTILDFLTSLEVKREDSIGNIDIATIVIDKLTLLAIPKIKDEAGKDGENTKIERKKIMNISLLQTLQKAITTGVVENNEETIREQPMMENIRGWVENQIRDVKSTLNISNEQTKEAMKLTYTNALLDRAITVCAPKYFKKSKKINKIDNPLTSTDLGIEIQTRLVDGLYSFVTRRNALRDRLDRSGGSVEKFSGTSSDIIGQKFLPGDWRAYMAQYISNRDTLPRPGIAEGKFKLEDIPSMENKYNAEPKRNIVEDERQFDQYLKEVYGSSGRVSRIIEDLVGDYGYKDIQLPQAVVSTIRQNPKQVVDYVITKIAEDSPTEELYRILISAQTDMGKNEILPSSLTILTSDTPSIRERKKVVGDKIKRILNMRGELKTLEKWFEAVGVYHVPDLNQIPNKNERPVVETDWLNQDVTSSRARDGASVTATVDIVRSKKVLETEIAQLKKLAKIYGNEKTQNDAAKILEEITLAIEKEKENAKRIIRDQNDIETKISELRSVKEQIRKDIENGKIDRENLTNADIERIKNLKRDEVELTQRQTDLMLEKVRTQNQIKMLTAEKDNKTIFTEDKVAEKLERIKDKIKATTVALNLLDEKANRIETLASKLKEEQKEWYKEVSDDDYRENVSRYLSKMLIDTREETTNIDAISSSINGLVDSMITVGNRSTNTDDNEVTNIINIEQVYKPAEGLDIPYAQIVLNLGGNNSKVLLKYTTQHDEGEDPIFLPADLAISSSLSMKEAAKKAISHPEEEIRKQLLSEFSSKSSIIYLGIMGKLLGAGKSKESNLSITYRINSANFSTYCLQLEKLVRERDGKEKADEFYRGKNDRDKKNMGIVRMFQIFLEEGFEASPIKKIIKKFKSTNEAKTIERDIISDSIKTCENIGGEFNPGTGIQLLTMNSVTGLAEFGIKEEGVTWEEILKSLNNKEKKYKIHLGITIKDGKVSRNLIKTLAEKSVKKLEETVSKRIESGGKVKDDLENMNNISKAEIRAALESVVKIPPKNEDSEGRDRAIQNTRSSLFNVYFKQANKFRASEIAAVTRIESDNLRKELAKVLGLKNIKIDKIKDFEMMGGVIGYFLTNIEDLIYEIDEKVVQIGDDEVPLKDLKLDSSEGREEYPARDIQEKLNNLFDKLNEEAENIMSGVNTSSNEDGVDVDMEILSDTQSLIIESFVELSKLRAEYRVTATEEGMSIFNYAWKKFMKEINEIIVEKRGSKGRMGLRPSKDGGIEDIEDDQTTGDSELDDLLKDFGFSPTDAVPSESTTNIKDSRLLVTQSGIKVHGPSVGKGTGDRGHKVDIFSTLVKPGEATGIVDANTVKIVAPKDGGTNEKSRRKKPR